MRLGILQAGHAPEELIRQVGDYDALFARLLASHGLQPATFNVVDMEFPPGPEAADGWLITGSRHGAYEAHPFIAPLEALIRAIRAQGRPLVGICFGHQIIAQALGGTVEKFPGGWCVGRQEYDYRGETIALNAWHQDQVTAVPEDAEVIGSSPFCAHAALQYGTTVWTMQPHPEFDGEVIDALIRLRGNGVVPQPLLDSAAASVNVPVAQARIAAEIAAFLKAAGPPAS